MQRRPNIPGFEVQGELGRGGMATVYLAIQVALARKIALKVMDATLASNDPAFQERFMREGRIIGKLGHPNVVTVYDTSYADGVYFIAMEYLPGGSLKERIPSGGMEVTTAVMMVRALASALGYAHSRGVVHRDLKPLNVLFRANQPAPVLTDFGVARVRENTLPLQGQSLQPLTQIGVSVGTPAYMSPEQALALPDVDGRADLYSLGIMFYEMLLGHRPFVSDDPYEVARMHVEDPAPRLPAALRSLQPILDRLLEKRPQHRYPDAAGLLQALEGWEQATRLEATQPSNSRPVAAREAATDDLPTTAVPVPVAEPSPPKPTPTTVPMARDLPPTLPVAKPPVPSPDVTQPTPEPPPAWPWVWVAASVLLLAGLGSGGTWWLLQPSVVTPSQQLEQLLTQPWAPAEIEQALALGEQLQAQYPGSQPNLLRSLVARLAQTLRTLPDTETRKTAWQQRGLALVANYPALVALQPTSQLTTEPVPITTERPTPSVQNRAEQLQTKAQVQLAAGRWVEPPGDNAEETYRALRLWDVAAAEQGLRGLADILYRQAQMAWERQDTDAAKRWLNQAQARFPADPRWVALAQQWEATPTRAELASLSLAELLALAQRQFDAAQVTDPPGDNAVETYREMLRRQAGHPQAQAALRQIADGFEALAQARQRKGERDKALLAVDRGLQVLPDHAGLRALRGQLQ